MLLDFFLQKKWATEVQVCEVAHIYTCVCCVCNFEIMQMGSQGEIIHQHGALTSLLYSVIWVYSIILVFFIDTIFTTVNATKQLATS